MKVAIYYIDDKILGGPSTYIKTLYNSPLSERHDLVPCYQEKTCSSGGFRLLLQMVKKIKEINPDVLHIQGGQMEGLFGVLAGRIAKCKTIVLTIHGLSFDDTKSPWYKRLIYFFLIESLSMMLAHKVYFVCKYAANRLYSRAFAGRRNKGYIYNPIPVVSSDYKDIISRAKLGIAEQTTIISTSSRITLDKGYDTLTRIIKHFSSNSSLDVVFIIMGDGDYLETLQSVLKEEITKRQVIITGAISNVSNYLSISDIYIFPSKRENLPISILEACSNGLPVLATDVGGIPEIISNSYNGFLAKLDDHNDFIHKLEYLISNPGEAKRMGQNGKALMSERFALNAICTQIESIYID